MSDSIEQRVARVADELFAEHQHVAAVDVLNWIGWLPAPRIDEWRQGRVECLESTMQVSEAQRDRLVERQSTPPELVVIMPLKGWTCASCGDTGDLLLMQEEGPVCMACAALDHLVYLPRGDAGLTRRAHRASELSAVIVRFSRTRKRYERQGLLVEPDALAAAERD